MTRNRIRLATLAAGVFALALLGTTGAGVASSTQLKSEISITEGGPTGAKGDVTSGKRVCERGRKVTLQYRAPGQSGFASVGTAKTDQHGKWAVNASLSQGDYRAKVAKKTVAAKRGTAALTCLPAHTPIVQF